jgi:hypothetical protein
MSAWQSKRSICVTLVTFQSSLGLALYGTRCRRGAVACEAALATPILLLFALGGVDMGRVAHYQQIVSNAARTAAEVGATRQFTDFTRPTWEADVRQAAVDELQNIPGFSEEEMEFSISISGEAEDGARIEIEVGFPFQTVANWPLLPSEIHLHKRLVTRQFR